MGEETTVNEFILQNETLEKNHKGTIYSHSRVSTFEQCPLKFKLGYIDKIEGDFENTIEAFMGSMVHDTLEKLYKDLKFQKKNTLPELIEYYNSIWESEWSEEIKVIREEYDAENYRKMGEKFITDYYNRYTPFDQTKTIGIENRIVIKLDDEGRYLLQGYIDRLSAGKDGLYEVHDYKTANTLMDQEKADKDRQLALYAIAVKQRYSDCKKVKLIWHYLAFDKDIISERTDEQLKELRAKTLATIKKIESAKEFFPVESPLCGWCQYRSKCPKFKHLYEVKELPEEEFSEDDGVKLVNRFALIKEKEKIVNDKLAEVQEKIYKFSEQKGVDRLYGKNKALTIWKKDCYKFPGKNDPEYDELVADLKEAGLWNFFCSLDKWKLEKDFGSLKIEPEKKDKVGRHSRRETIKRVYMRDRKK